MVAVIFLFVIIIFTITLYATNLTAIKSNKNMLLGVTLPYDFLEASQVLSIVKEYKKANNLLMFIFLLFSTPIFIFTYYPSFIVVYVFLWIGLLLFINNRLYISYFKKLYNFKKNNMSSSNLTIIDYADDDIYWEKGYYCNPNDKSVMVEKRIGYGLTVNMATTKGKLLTFGTIIPVIIMLIFLSIQLIILDTSSFTLEVEGNIAKINAPLYGYSFNIKNIETIDLINTLPKGAKTNGAATDRYSLGNFSLNGYGKSKMYIYKNNPPYIVIKLNTIYIFLNGKTPEITKAYYEKLR